MKVSELHRKYADSLDLCEKYGADKRFSIRVFGKTIAGYPLFTENPNEYTFAIAVVEGKPVFTGDKLFHNDGTEYIVQDVDGPTSDGRMAFITVSSPWVDGDWVENYTWEPPKPKTFMLNGVELPAPVKRDDMSMHLDMHIGGKTYYFNNAEDLTAVIKSLQSLLDGKS